MELIKQVGRSRICFYLRSIGIILFVTLLTLASAQAQQLVKELDDPVRVELQTPIVGEIAAVGQLFDAELDEDVQYKSWTLPAGTTFHGHITKMRPSRSFSRAGYVILNVDEARTPDGKVFTFDPNQYGVRNKKLYNPEATTFKETIVQQIPYTAVSTGTSIPLKNATDLNGGVVFAIAAGARMALGATMALFDDDLAGQPVPTKIARGVWEGTGIPRGYNFLFVKDPEPNFQAGDQIQLYFAPDGLEALLKAHNSRI